MNRPTKRSVKQENYEHVLMCLICRSLFDDHDHQPKFLPCHHTFCKECLREYVRQMGDEIECPSCRKVATIPAAGVAALQTNFYAKYIQSLVYGCGAGGDGMISECEHHTSHKLQYLCKDCVRSICSVCIEEDGCANHKLVPLTTATEDYHQKIDASFASANSLIERKKVELEALLKMLSEEKDQSLLKIDSTFEQYVHTLNRRATLLKNKVIDIYNEHTSKLDADLEEISTAMTCIVSLKEYHETMISKGDFTDVEKGIEELNEVCTNIQEIVQPRTNQIQFEDRHGSDKFRGCVKDLGRVICKSAALKAVEKSEEDGSNNTAIPGVQSPIVSPNKLSETDELNVDDSPNSAGIPLGTNDDVLKQSGLNMAAGEMLENSVQKKSKETNPTGEVDRSNQHSLSGADLCDSQTLTADSIARDNNNDGKKQTSCPKGSPKGNSLVCSKGGEVSVTKHATAGQQSPRSGAKAGKGSSNDSSYWMPSRGGLKTINAEMSSEQTSL